MKLLFVSADTALTADLAWQIRRGGHDVRYYIETEHNREVGDGFVPKADDWRAEAEWTDAIVSNDIWVGSDVGTGALTQESREEGHAVVGGMPSTDRFEEDRGYAMDVPEEHGVNTVEQHVFCDFNEGIEYARRNCAPYVIRPPGEVQNVKRLLYAGNEEDGSDVVEMPRAYKQAWGHRMKGLQLQRKIEGVKIAVCGFLDGEMFVNPVNFNLEHKELFPGNIGPSTGEIGTSIFWIGRSRLFEETLDRLESWFAEEDYVGSIDTNCIVNEHGIYLLEFTLRFGYPMITLQEESFESSTAQLFFDLTYGNDLELSVHGGYQIVVRIVLPPFLFTDEKIYDENSRNTAVAFETDSREGVHTEDAKLVGGQWRAAGESGIPLVVTGKGETMQEARKQVYDRVDDIAIPNLYYRDGIGERWIDGDGDRLLAWGHLGSASERKIS